MKKLIAVLLTLVLMMTCFSPALAEYYHQHQSNEATFETLEEARANAPAIIAQTPGSVAMGNASEEVRAAADEVTLSNNEDGIAVFLKRLIKE